MNWTDNRLIPPSNMNYSDEIHIDPRIIGYMWVPAAYVVHVREITSPKLLSYPHYAIMNTEGAIRYSVGKITRFSCPMDFSAYPFDTQTCFMTMEDYRFSSDYLNYKWGKPIEIGEMSKHPQFTFDFEAVERPGVTHAGNIFPEISVKIVLSRSITSHLMNTYFPSTLLVVVSWLSFLMPPHQVPGRMVLSITTLLALISMFSAVRKEGPQVSYAKAIDQWMLTCLFFVFLVLIEFTLVLFLLNKADNEKPQSGTQSEDSDARSKFAKWAELLEKWCWKFLVFCFACFASAYWTCWYYVY